MEDSLYRVPIKGLVQDDEGRVLVIRTNSTSDGWQLPGGGMDYGEEPVEALQRELQEELGVAPEWVDSTPCATTAQLAGVGSRAGQWRLWIVYKVRMDIDKIILGNDVDALDWAMVTLSELGQKEVHPNEQKLFSLLIELGL